jgi:CheY-like chemotaxis protein
MTILLVDDDVSSINALSNLLKFEYDFEVATNGVDALEKFRGRTFDLVVTDVKMPRMDGIELLRNIRALGNKTPIIVMTGYPDKTVKNESERLGVFAFITKPINVEYFMETLNFINKGINN